MIPTGAGSETKTGYRRSPTKLPLVAHDYKPVSMMSCATVLNTTNKLYGRETEKRILQEAYNRRCSGQEATLLSRELILISGASGTGKSCLAGTLHAVVEGDGGFFVKGKFDQLQQPKPYSAFVSAFSDFAELAIAKGEELVLSIKQCAQAGVGRMGGGLLVETIPSLQIFFGASEEQILPYISAEVQKQCFMVAFREFVRAVSSPERPLVLFLDDLQWADQGSLDLLSVLANDREQEGLLLLGAVRGNEVGRNDPVSVALRGLEEKQVVISEINLSNFSREEIRGYLSLAYSSTTSSDLDVEKLSDILYVRSKGNLFSMHQVLKLLREDGILRRADQSTQWRLNIARVDSSLRQRRSTAEVMVGAVERLPQGVQEVLETASCLGGKFQARHLALILPHLDVSASLELARDKEVVHFNKETGVAWFVHDQMQEAAYAMIEVDRRPSMHLTIGRQLFKQFSPEETDENLFLTVNQLALGIALIQDVEERNTLAVLCLRAGQKAVSSSAFVTASDYLKVGITCLGPRHWRNKYDLSLALFNAAAEVEYCNANYEKTDALIDEVLDNARSFDDEIQSHNTRMFALAAQQKFHEACDIGLYVLNELGVPFPTRPSKLIIMMDILKTKWMLRRKSADNILNLPVMTRPDRLATMRILNLLFLYFIFSNPNAVPLVATRIVQLTLVHGLSGMGCSGFGMYGMLLCGVLGEIEDGYKYCQVALRILERFQGKIYLARVYAPVYGMVIHWKEPFHNCLAPLRTAHRVGLESGDIEFALVCAALCFLQAFLAGVPLPSLYKDGCKLMEEFRVHKQDVARGLIVPALQMVCNLMGQNANPCVLTGEFMTEEAFIQAETESNHPASITSLHVRKMMIAYYMNDFDLAREEAQKSRSIGNVIVASSSTASQAFFDGMTAMEMARYRSRPKRAHLKTARQNLKKMRTWANHAPRNYMHKVHLLEAEMYVVRGKLDKSLDKYQRSVELAKTEGFVHDQALACERAGVALRHFGQEQEACKYFVKAHVLYGDWGARAKVDQLDHLIGTGDVTSKQ